MRYVAWQLAPFDLLKSTIKSPLIVINEEEDINTGPIISNNEGQADVGKQTGFVCQYIYH